LDICEHKINITRNSRKWIASSASPASKRFVSRRQDKIDYAHSYQMVVFHDQDNLSAVFHCSLDV